MSGVQVSGIGGGATDGPLGRAVAGWSQSLVDVWAWGSAQIALTRAGSRALELLEMSRTETGVMGVYRLWLYFLLSADQGPGFVLSC